MRGTSQADIEAELPPLTPTNQAQLAFSYSAREPHHHQKPLPTQRHASPAAHSVSNHHRLPGGSSCAYDAEAVPPRKRKLEPSPSLEDRATVHSGPPSPAQAEDEGQWQRQPRRHAEGHEEDDAAYMDDEAATGGKPGSLTKRRRVRSTTALPEGGAHPGSASADDRVMSGRSGSGSGASPSSSSRTRYVSSSSSSANGRASSHLPPKKSHKQNVGGGGHRPRASSSSSPTVNSTRQTEQEILEEFNLSGEGGGLDYEADVVDDEPNSDVSPRGAKKRAAADRDPRRRKEREKREGSVAAAAGGSSASAAGGVKKKGSGGSGSSGGGGGGGVKLKDPASGNDLTSGASFRRGAEIILKREGKPMDAREIVRVGLKEGFCPPPHIYGDAVARSDGELTRSFLVRNCNNNNNNRVVLHEGQDATEYAGVAAVHGHQEQSAIHLRQGEAHDLRPQGVRSVPPQPRMSKSPIYPSTPHPPPPLPFIFPLDVSAYHRRTEGSTPPCPPWPCTNPPFFFFAIHCAEKVVACSGRSICVHERTVMGARWTLTPRCLP